MRVWRGLVCPCQVCTENCPGRVSVSCYQRYQGDQELRLSTGVFAAFPMLCLIAACTTQPAPQPQQVPAQACQPLIIENSADEAQALLPELYAEARRDLVLIGSAVYLCPCAEPHLSQVAGQAADSGVAGRAVESGVAGRAADSGIAGRADASGVAGRVDDSGVAARADDSGVAGRVADGGVRGRVADSGAGGRTDDGMVSGRGDDSGVAGRTDDGRLAGRGDDSGIGGRVGDSSRLGRAAPLNCRPDASRYGFALEGSFNSPVHIYDGVSLARMTR
jgi:hypothetical protein